MYWQKKNSKVSISKPLTHLAGLFLLLTVSITQSTGVFAAVPGLPFAEDFTDPELKNHRQTTADWVTKTLIQM